MLSPQGGRCLPEYGYWRRCHRHRLNGAEASPTRRQNKAVFRCGVHPEAEGLRLLKAENKAGYFGVYHKPGHPRPYQAQVSRGGKVVYLGLFATAEEAALCVARTPEGQAAAKQAAAAPPLTSEEVRQQAEAEGLALL